jgi:hypothetical protein
MDTPHFNEDILSEKPALEQLKAMGCTVISGERFDPQEWGDSERTHMNKTKICLALFNLMAYNMSSKPAAPLLQSKRNSVGLCFYGGN